MTDKELALLQIRDCCVQDEQDVVNYICDPYLLTQRFEEFYMYRRDMYEAGQQNPHLPFESYVEKQAKLILEELNNTNKNEQ